LYLDMIFSKIFWWTTFN